jgi:hypothetical protein
MDWDDLMEAALSIGVSVVKTRYRHPVVVDRPDGDRPILLMPPIITDSDASLIVIWLNGLQTKSEDVA